MDDDDDDDVPVSLPHRGKKIQNKHISKPPLTLHVCFFLWFPVSSAFGGGLMISGFCFVRIQKERERESLFFFSPCILFRQNFFIDLDPKGYFQNCSMGVVLWKFSNYEKLHREKGLRFEGDALKIEQSSSIFWPDSKFVK